jgi:hypothetical protein
MGTVFEETVFIPFTEAVPETTSGVSLLLSKDSTAFSGVVDVEEDADGGFDLSFANRFLPRPLLFVFFA